MHHQKSLFNEEMKKSDFSFDKTLGGGNFAKVVKAKYLINDLYYAIKIINKNQNFSHKNLLREIFLQKNLDHNNIVHYYGSFEDKDNYYLVLEYVPNGSLQDKINKHMECFKYPFKVELIKEDIIINIFKQLLNGLIYLHNKNIIHRDIKPDNILFDKDNNIKLTDFGLCALIKSDLNNSSINKAFIYNCSEVGHKDYTCPEIVKHEKYDKKCDIFSLGMTIFYLMSFDLPYISFLNNNKTQIKRDPKEITLNQVYSQQLRNLVERMISEDPKIRPTAQEAYDILIKIEEPLKDNYNIMENENNVSSFMCVIRCLCSIQTIDFKNLKEIIFNKLKNIGKEFLKNFLPLNLCGMKEIINYKDNSMINDLYFNYYLNKIRFLLSLKTNRIYGNEDINPIIVMEELINIFTKEFIAQIPWKNNIFQIPLLMTSNIYPQFINKEIPSAIQYFQTNYAGPFVDNFYFLMGYIVKCKKCNNLYFSYKIKYFLSIQAKNEENLNIDIRNYIYKDIENTSLKCFICNSVKQQAERWFINSPPYLIIEFKNRNNININDTIDISNFKLNNVGPSKYEFFSVISELESENDNNYICTIKTNNNYIFYSENNPQNCGEEAKKLGFPYIVIYKGII